MVHQKSLRTYVTTLIVVMAVTLLCGCQETDKITSVKLIRTFQANQTGDEYRYYSLKMNVTKKLLLLSIE